jgi:hypothetical protein
MLDNGTRVDTHVGNVLDASRDAEDAVVDAGDDLADAGLDAGQVTEVGDVLAGLA